MLLADIKRSGDGSENKEYFCYSLFANISFVMTAKPMAESGLRHNYRRVDRALIAVNNPSSYLGVRMTV
jgi:hypothetical protein